MLKRRAGWIGRCSSAPISACSSPCPAICGCAPWSMWRARSIWTGSVQLLRRLAGRARRLRAPGNLGQRGPLGASGLTYLPYLSDAGIIAPVVEPEARAVFSGLSLSHSRADLAPAVYEGLVLSVRDCFAATTLPVDRIRLVGGGSRSAFVAQMLADVMGIPSMCPPAANSAPRGLHCWPAPRSAGSRRCARRR